MKREGYGGGRKGGRGQGGRRVGWSKVEGEGGGECYCEYVTLSAS